MLCDLAVQCRLEYSDNNCYNKILRYLYYTSSNKIDD